MFFLIPIIAGIASTAAATATISVSAAEIVAAGTAAATIIKAAKDKKDEE